MVIGNTFAFLISFPFVEVSLRSGSLTNTKQHHRFRPNILQSSSAFCSHHQHFTVISISKRCGRLTYVSSKVEIRLPRIVLQLNPAKASI